MCGIKSSQVPQLTIDYGLYGLLRQLWNYKLCQRLSSVIGSRYITLKSVRAAESLSNIKGVWMRKNRLASLLRSQIVVCIEIKLPRTTFSPPPALSCPPSTAGQVTPAVPPQSLPALARCTLGKREAGKEEDRWVEGQSE